MTDKLTLIETIAREPRFSKFSNYLSMAGVAAALTETGQFTVFVPSDEAFAKIPEAEMNVLLDEPGKVRLKALLSYHIVPGKIMAVSVGSESVRNSISGEQIRFADYRGIKVNGIGLLRRNIEASNGVVHSLDTVLSPPAPSSKTNTVSTLDDAPTDAAG